MSGHTLSLQACSVERWLELCSTYLYDPHRNLRVNSGSHTWPVFCPAGWKTPAMLTGVLSVENVFHNAIGKSIGVLY